MKISGFHYHHNELQVDGLPLSRVAEQFGTPAYVYSGAAIIDRLQQMQTALAGLPAQICFAVKANSNGAILQLLGRHGAGADIVSEGELRRALKAGIAADHIVFSGVGKTAGEIRYALQSGIKQFNIESRNEVQLVAEIAQTLGVVARATIRVNPDVDALTHKKISTGKSENKFGIPLTQALGVFADAAKLPSLQLCGLHVHIGSQILQIEPYAQTLQRIADTVISLRANGYTIDTIDLGGGLGISYRNAQPEEFPLEHYVRLIRQYIAPLNTQIILEPGRYLVGNAGILLCKTLFIKHGEDRQFAVLDAAMNDLMRPSMYDAWHDILPIERKAHHEQRYDIVGPVCETGDTFAQQRALPALEQNDLIAIFSAGAYGSSMSSTYNSRPLIAEVLVLDGHAHLIRRRQSYDELLAQELLLK